MINRLRFAVLLLPMLGFVTVAQAQTAPERLAIVTATGSHPFTVEVMRTDPEREKGLMYRRFMPAARGMLFDFKQVEPGMMWMKNTYIPLDMVFIGPDGRVVSTAENAEPLSERIIPSGGAVLGVLEVNAGTLAKIAVKPGDRVENAMFPK